MGLGALLINPEAAARRLRAPAPPEPPRPSAPRADGGRRTARRRNATVAPEPPTAPAPPESPLVPPSPDAVAAALAAEREDADHVILWPALGCPGLVNDQTPQLEIIFLSRAEQVEFSGETKDERVRKLLRRVKVMHWSEARRPYAQDDQPWLPRGPSLDSLVETGGIVIRTKKNLATYRSDVREGPRKFGDLLHTVADVVPKVYLDEGFKSIVSVRLKLKQTPDLAPGAMYNLYYPPENGLVREVLEDLDSHVDLPYDGIPLLKRNDIEEAGGPRHVYRGRGRDRNREHRVRLLHPVMMLSSGEREYLNVAHVTDPHTATLWDYLDNKIFPNHPADEQQLDVARTPQLANTDVTQQRPGIETRFNNPNLNLRNLTQLLNQRQGPNRVDLILQTGDLIDYNRGFNHADRHDPDLDYVYNLSWIRYYELLLLDYQRPTYTSLGNHDWRLNPYPPRIGPEADHVWVLAYLFLALTGVGTACGTVFGALESVDGEGSPSAGILILQHVLGPFTAPLTLFLFGTLLAGPGIGLDTAMDALLSPPGLTVWLLFGWVLGFLLLILFRVLHESGALALGTTGEGALWGSIFGGSLGGIVFLVGIFLLFTERDYMTNITNLLSSDDGSDFDALLDHNVGYLNAFGKDGLLYMTERSFDWYSLVINPFLDYAFTSGNTTVLMVDWGGSEILSGDPPLADDAFTDRQWELIKEWVEQIVEHRQALTAGGKADKLVVPLMGLHSPVFCPMLDLNLQLLFSAPRDIDDSELERGIMEEHRDDLIELLYQLGHSTKHGNSLPIAVYTLGGHSHVYDIFAHTDAEHVAWFEATGHRALNLLAVAPGKGLHFTTACAGPPSDGKEGMRQKRPSGCRLLTFDRATGRLIGFEEIDSTTAKFGANK